MGGGGWYYVPKVWSPSGGWWSNPPQWKRNTGIACAFILVSGYAVFRFSANRERRPVPGHYPVPSERWAKHAVGDVSHDQ